MLFKVPLIKDGLFARCAYFYFKFVGLATMNFRSKIINNGKVKCSLFTSSRLGMLHNVVVIFIVIIANFYTLQGAGYHPAKKQFWLESDRIIDMFRIFFAIGASIYALLVFCFHQDKAIKIANKIKKLAELIVNLNAKWDDDNSLALWRISRGVCLAHGVLWFLAFAATPRVDSRMLIYFLSVDICDLVMASMFLQYTLSLKLLRRLFEIVNENFIRVSRDIIAVRRDAISIVHGTNDEFGLETKLQKFLQLKDLHLALCEVAEDLGEFYSGPVVAGIWHFFVALILYAYFVTKTVMERNEAVMMGAFFFCSIAIVHYIAPLVSLTTSASAVIAESKRTGKIVSKWMGHSQNQQIVNMLNQFSNYSILHPKLEFTGAGLFNLDGSLLMSIAGSITTYLVILLQFQDSKCKPVS